MLAGAGYAFVRFLAGVAMLPGRAGHASIRCLTGAAMHHGRCLASAGHQRLLPGLCWLELSWPGVVLETSCALAQATHPPGSRS